jgi:hypothetical protein
MWPVSRFVRRFCSLQSCGTLVCSHLAVGLDEDRAFRPNSTTVRDALEAWREVLCSGLGDQNPAV